MRKNIHRSGPVQVKSRQGQFYVHIKCITRVLRENERFVSQTIVIVLQICCTYNRPYQIYQYYRLSKNIMFNLAPFGTIRSPFQ